MNERIQYLREQSYQAPVLLSTERAELLTDFYRQHHGKYPAPVMRALAFKHLCEHQTIYIGDQELIVGERGPSPKAVPTFPELTCHSLRDLEILNSREKIRYAVSPEAMQVYRDKIIPYWQDRALRDRLLARLPDEWQAAYGAGIFTEFMEQRAPGHTALDGKCYRQGLMEFKAEIAGSLGRLDFKKDPEATAKQAQLNGMAIACEAVMAFARRHAELAESLAQNTADTERQEELAGIAANCRRVPALAPQNFWQALQMYWFMHLGTIIELNGWDAMNPGHLDHHLYPFFSRDLENGALTQEKARELLSCFWIKFNNHPAPPKVGVTAAESGTYNDFTNINLGGLLPDGGDGVNELSYLLLEVIDEIHLLQPQANIQLSRKNPDRFLKAACRVIRQGYGYPSLFNADTVVEQMIRSGKSVEDARQGGTSGCVETGAFGKEAYILTGYLNLPKILEVTLNNGRDPLSGKMLGLESGDPSRFGSFPELLAAFKKQLHHFLEIKIKGNQFIERIYAAEVPAVFLSVLIDDCIEKGRDYNDGGPRYNTSYIQCVGIGTITDSLSAINSQVFEKGQLTMRELLAALAVDFKDRQDLRLMLANKTPRYGNDDNRADSIMRQVFDALYDEIEGRPNTKGGRYHLLMLPTTSHIYFGSLTGASADGRRAKTPLSEGISPVQGADRRGPTAVIKSAGKMDHIRTGGTLLNMKLMPGIIADEAGIEKMARLIRTYFRYDAHHVQFNIVDAETLKKARQHPEAYRDLIVRVAGYSDYFCNLSQDLQEEIISRTTHGEL